MDYQQLKATVGDDPHDLADAIQIDSRPAAERVHLLFQALDDQPIYGIAMYLKHEFDHGNEAIRSQILTRFRHALEGDQEELVEPVLYSLWCDYFEDFEVVEQTWQQLLTPAPDTLLLRRLLPVAGPVPWRIKRPMLETLVSQPQWHLVLFECLLRSAFDVSGSIDKTEAGQLLRRLDLPADTEHLAELRAALPR